MSRLIGADELLDKAWDAENGLGWEKVVSIKDVMDAPTIDAVEVVRCKDCRYRYVDGENVRYNVCELNHNKVQSDEWFCADGERREDGKQ